MAYKRHSLRYGFKGLKWLSCSEIIPDRPVDTKQLPKSSMAWRTSILHLRSGPPEIAIPWRANKQPEPSEACREQNTPTAGDDLAGFLGIARPSERYSAEAAEEKAEKTNPLGRKLAEEQKPVGE
jgi:hypothetical protein